MYKSFAEIDVEKAKEILNKSIRQKSIKLCKKIQKQYQTGLDE